MWRSRIFLGEILLLTTSLSAGTPELNLSRTGTHVELAWPAAIKSPEGQITHPFFELERSRDLNTWSPIGERLRAPNATQDEAIKVSVDLDASPGFYRVRSFTPQLSRLASETDEIFGFGDAFREELARLGQISVNEFESIYPPPTNYLSVLPWDPTTARFWPDFNADPAVVNQGKIYGQPGYRLKDFRLNPAERVLFQQNGFVVSGRLGSSSPLEDSFADSFYDIWFNDLPVFVSTDALLQAWHRTYDSILAETEETFLFETLWNLLDQMSSRIPELSSSVGAGPLRDSLRDVDHYLTVARALLGQGQQAHFGDVQSRVDQTLSDITALRLKQVELFGQCRTVDFSQFRVRGHYLQTPRLTRYFQSIVWLGRIDFAVAGDPIERCPGVPSGATPREIGGAVILWDLLNRSGQMSNWLNLDRTVQAFVGWPDSLNFAQLGGILSGAGITSVDQVADLDTLNRIQQEILSGNLGVQNIRSDFVISPLGPEQVQLPRSFLFFGQRFVPDSWALSKVVFDDILWVENGVTNKVNRRVPSALDIAFAVLGNDHIVPNLAARMRNTQARTSSIHAEKWRDGLPYQHNLAAVRNVIDSQQNSAWDSNIYVGWLNALRQLSLPTTDSVFPDVMRTRAWAMKTLATQLASWTHLRHDTVLYAKESYTSAYACFYPEGYVEPHPEFWKALRETASRAATLIESLPYSGEYVYLTTTLDGTNRVVTTNSVTLQHLQARQVQHLRSFSETLSTLEQLSIKELAEECFNEQDELFFKNLIQRVGMIPYGSAGIRKYDGWYPKLFYRGVHFERDFHNADRELNFHEFYGANAVDRVTTAVHTDVPSLEDQGGVLHQGTGNVHLMMIAINSGADRAVYAGPVLSHYEFEVTGSPTRLTDSDWDALFPQSMNSTFIDRQRIEGFSSPSWTQGYLVPSF